MQHPYDAQVYQSCRDKFLFPEALQQNRLYHRITEADVGKDTVGAHEVSQSLMAKAASIKLDSGSIPKS